MIRSRINLSGAYIALAYNAALLLFLFSVGAVVFAILTFTVERQEAPDEAGMIPVASDR